tara:strand:- start:553 stop:1005 length:453 start_codon:yes stop_codon:yes gene_type:complete
MATLKAVSEEILRDLSKIDGLPRAIGAALQSETLDRIFTDGVASDGSQIGEYSIYTIALKKEDGRFTSDNVNLRNTDTLANSWTFQANKNSVELGFLSGSRTDKKTGLTATNTQVIKNIEDRYGKDIFQLTSGEINLVEDLTKDFINGIF